MGGAAQQCERALELTPNWAEAHYLYGTVLEQMVSWPKMHMRSGIRRSEWITLWGYWD